MSASRIATSDTSGRSRPSRRRLMPTRDVELTEAQVADDLHALHGVDVRMQIANLDAVFVQIVGQILRHPLGERSDENALILGDAQVDFRKQIVDLGLRWTDFQHRVDQTRRPHELLDDLSCMRLLVFRGRRGDEHRLRQELLELIEAQRAVIERRRQSETVVDEVFLARTIAAEHPSDLRNRDVRFVDERQRVSGQIVDQRRRRLARRASRQVTRVVLDALAEPDLDHHLDVEAGALLDPLRFDQLGLSRKEFLLRRELDLNLLYRVEHLVPACHIVARWKHREARELLPDVARQRIE